MGKWFCAGCDQERPEFKEFAPISGNPNFCKICACATASYYADEPRPKVSVNWNFKRLPKPELKRKQVDKLHGAKYITGELKEEQKKTLTRPLEDIIRERWNHFALKRIAISDNPEKFQKREKPKKPIPSTKPAKLEKPKKQKKQKKETIRFDLIFTEEDIAKIPDLYKARARKEMEQNIYRESVKARKAEEKEKEARRQKKTDKIDS